MRNGKPKEDIIRELKDDIEYLEWEIESKQKELKEKKEWLEDISREPDWDNIGTERRLGCKQNKDERQERDELHGQNVLPS